MDGWANRPNREHEAAPLSIMRSRPGKAYTGIAVSAAVIGAYTHYWRGRSRICTAPECEACEAQRLARWYGYIGLWQPQTGTITILEITASCWETIETHLEKYGTLRGARITARRASAKINARLLIEIEQGPYAEDKIPCAPRVQEQLERMWEVGSPKKEQEKPRYTNRIPIQGQQELPMTNGHDYDDGQRSE